MLGDDLGRARRLRISHRPVSPAQRLAREQGTVIKDWGGRLPVAVVYPNTYYIGMSNLGIQTLYSLLNSYGNVVAERVFWEGDGKPRPLATLSLESRRPLADFALVVFSISYELDYFNVVRILRASGIPLYASERDERHPLVMAGGACITANPMPLAPFFDLTCIGEAEPIMPALLSLVADGISDRRDKLLEALARLPGVYVPRYYSGTRVARQWAENLDDFPVTSVVLTRDTEFGDLYLIEVERGCNWSCRFCLVSSAFCPMRYRSLDGLMAQAELGLRYRRRLGLIGPVVADHPQIEELLVRLRQMGAGLAISSLRVSPLPQQLLRELAGGGVKTITLAPEAGSQRLRRLIGKGISEDDILEAVAKVAQAGIKQLKLYFMIGLPSETDDDIEAIIRLATKCKQILDKWPGGIRLSLNIAPFVPKAGTPFQWLPMADVTTLNGRLSLLKKALPARGIRLRSESPAWSQVQGVLARGDVTLAKVLAAIDEVTLAGWRRAVARCRLDTDFYAHKRWPLEKKLPWSIIDLGIKPGRLEAELKKALA